LHLSDIKLLEALQEILILQSCLLEFLLAELGNIELKDLARVLKDFSLRQIAFNVKVEDKVI